MAPHRANDFPPHLLMWQRVREYAVPPSMIETATARRAAGDWAGACAAARVDVDLDLRAVCERHGHELTTRLRADLRRLAPDLLRWHLPRIAPDGRLRPGLTLSLARYGAVGAPPAHLVARTPPAWADAGQRVSLALWEGQERDTSRHPHPHPDRRFRLDLHRHLWDAERSGELTRRCGADGAWRAPRATLDPPWWARGFPELPGLPGQPGGVPDSPWAVAGWATEAELLLRSEGASRGAFTVRLGAHDRAVLALVAPDDSHAPVLRPIPEPLPPQERAALPVLPEAAARVLPDLALLRSGLITAERLHPLVARALAAAGRDPVTATAPEPADPHRVACRGEVHRIAPQDGVLAAVDHDPAQLRREELLVALGGPALPCLRAIDAVHRDPEALPAVRERLRHGDVTGALAVVEGLLGPRAILREGPLRDALEAAAARRLTHGLYRSGLLAGPPESGVADRDASDAAGHRPRLVHRTPLPARRKLSGRARPRTGQTL